MKKSVPAIKVHQWLDIWDKVKFDASQSRRKPEPFFYLFSINAIDLQQLSDVNRRKAEGKRSADVGIQRIHNQNRSDEISNYIQGGFPWSVLSNSQRISKEYSNLRMPGWLPTAIIANIKAPGTVRAGLKLKKDDSVIINPIKSDSGFATINYPRNYGNSEWNQKAKPIEIIDGQHRILSFIKKSINAGSFEIPVVAFYDLDISWQAYLFYVINIKPKKINTSLAYDLYPVLRVQEWLESSPDGTKIYRETRAQELTEMLWRHPKSPWKDRVDMLGDNKKAPVSQAAFIRSLISSFVKSWESRGKSIGGLYGAKISSINDEVLYWSRPQQAAFLIEVWRQVELAIRRTEAPWAISLRDEIKLEDGKDPAFYSKYSLLATDQGVRGILQVTNDICYILAGDLNLVDWRVDFASDEIDLKEVDSSLKDLESMDVSKFLANLFDVISTFDWRTSSAPKLTNSEKKGQMIFKGSSGYKALRKDLLELLYDSDQKNLSDPANLVFDLLGYER